MNRIDYISGKIREHGSLVMLGQTWKRHVWSPDDSIDFQLRDRVITLKPFRFLPNGQWYCQVWTSKRRSCDIPQLAGWDDETIIYNFELIN